MSSITQVMTLMEARNPRFASRRDERLDNHLDMAREPKANPLVFNVDREWPGGYPERIPEHELEDRTHGEP